MFPNNIDLEGGGGGRGAISLKYLGFDQCHRITYGHNCKLAPSFVCFAAQKVKIGKD